MLHVKMTNIKAPLYWCLVFAVALLLFDRQIMTFACLKKGWGLKAEEETIKRTLKLYNACFQDFYASAGMPAKLDEFPAVKPVKHELFRDIGFLTENRRVMIYDFADQAVRKISLVAPGKAEVETVEEWNYLYQKLADRTPFTRVRGISQGFRYTLRQMNGRWLVVDWEPIDIKGQTGNNEFYF